MLKKSIFQVFHTYSGIGTYNIIFQDCCWSNQGLNTTLIGDSIFYLTNQLTFFNPLFLEENSNPNSTNSISIIYAEANQPLVFSPNFFDSEGDSIVMNLVNVVGDEYQFPDEINPGPNNSFVLNDFNQVIWESPQLTGEYYFAYEIIEYRNEINIASTIGISYINVTGVTNTHELFRSKFSIFPNPSNESLFIEGEKFERIEIYNLQGILMMKSFDLSTNLIDISNLQQGIYFISLSQDNQIYSSKFVKN